MFIDRDAQPLSTVRRSGTQVELYTSRSFRSSERRRVYVFAQVYKHFTPNGVKISQLTE